MTIRLHKYIEGLEDGSTLVNTLIHDDEMASYAAFLSKYGKDAMCFDLGDIADYEETIQPIPELYKLTPFETCFYQFRTETPNGVVVSGILEHYNRERDIHEYAIIRDGSNCVIRCGVIEYPNCRVSVHPPEEQEYGIVLFQAVRVFKTILHCKNIETQRVDPDIKLQKARAKRGKMPLFSYHVLDIKRGPSEPSTPQGGTHASPRFHLRRGHIRRFDDGTYTWVSPCAVGSKSLGMVHKDYVFQAEAK